MRPDTLRRAYIANEIADNPEHPAWETIARRRETDMTIGGKPSDRRNRVETAITQSKRRTCPDCGQKLTWGHRCPPLVVLGQGDFKTVITGDDLAGTGSHSSPSFWKAARRFGGALLSFLRVRR